MQPSNRVHLPSLALFAVSALGFLGALTAAMGLCFLGGVTLLQEGTASEGLSPVLSYAWVGICLALMVLPGMMISFSRLAGIKLPDWKGPASGRAANWLMIFWPALLLGGQLASGVPGLDWLILPPLQLLVVGIPIFWFVETGRRKIGAHQTNRDWGLVSIGVVIIPALILMAEVALLGLIAGGFLVWVSGQPAVMEQISRLSQQIIDSPLDPSVLEDAITTLAGSPWFVFILLAVTAIFVPLIEELLKPAAMWFLAGKNLSQAEGFEAGLICGGVFAFLESLGLFGTPFPGQWSAVVVARLGTGLLHCLSSGLVGWAIVSAWHGRKGIQAGFVTLLAVFLHGLWNAFAVIYGFSAYLPEGSSDWIGMLNQIGMIGPFALAALTMIMYLFLILLNRRLQLQSKDAAQ